MDVNNDDLYDYDNNNDMADEDSLLCEGVDHGFDSDVEDEIPDGLPRARTFSLLMGRSNSSEQEEDEEDEEDDDVEEQVVVTKTGHKYEYYDQEDFPTLPDDTAHVSLANLCRRIRAPLYAYDEILQWAQEAHLSGYCFPTNAPTYRSMLSSLRSCLHLSHLSHGTAMIQKCGGGTLDFPIFDFASMFYDLIDDYRISPHLLINFECPNKPPSFNLQYLDEVHSGKWHRLTSGQLLKDANDVLSGIIFFSIALMFPTRISSQFIR